MKPSRFVLSCGLLLGACLPAEAAGPADSVVKVSASVRYPNLVRPWTKADKTDTVGTGVVIEGKKILTSAHLVLYATEVNIQARPGDEKIEARVEAVGPDIDLALLTVRDEKFFQSHPALARAKQLPRVQDTVVVYGFPVGGEDLAVTRGTVSRIGFVPTSRGVADLIIQVSAAINPGNSGGPAVVSGQMIGLVYTRLQSAENTSYLIPNEEIDSFLENRKGGPYGGKPAEAAGTTFQRLDNEALRDLLKLRREVKGILVIPPPGRPANYPLREFDVLTQIGEHAIDNEGRVRLPNGLRAPFFYLLPKLARGGTVPARVLRQGKPLSVELPVTCQDNRLIPEHRGEAPCYFIHGPLVFSPARADTLSVYDQLNPGLDVSRSPLLTRASDRVGFPGEELVVVTAPLFSHKIAKGYGNPQGHVVQEVNGVRIKNLRHLVEVLRDSTARFLVFRFAEAGSEILVFDRKQMDQATEEILEENGIAPSRRGSPDMVNVWKAKAAAARGTKAGRLGP